MHAGQATHCDEGSQGFCLFGFCFVFLFVCFSFKTGFLCVAPAVLELRNPPASAFQVLGLKACATT